MISLERDRQSDLKAVRGDNAYVCDDEAATGNGTRLTTSNSGVP